MYNPGVTFLPVIWISIFILKLDDINNVVMTVYCDKIMIEIMSRLIKRQNVAKNNSFCIYFVCVW